jgi:AraC-like DNA-binding protein
MRTVPAPAAVDVAVLEALFDQVPDVAFFVKDAAGRYTAVNGSLVARHGLRAKAQVLGKRPSDICPGEFGAVPSGQDATVLQTGHALHDHLELHWYAPHEPGWCLTTKLPLRDADGAVVGLIGVSRDLRAPVDPERIPARVAEALNRLEADPADPVTPSELARRAGMTPSRFARLLKRFFGLTPSQYITKVRVTAAADLLRETSRPVAQIAQECGFYDHSAFTRVFRNVTGLTPTQVRKG